MAKVRIFTVRGMSPVTEQVMEVELVADSPAEARQKAHDSGLKMVMVIGSCECDDGDGPKPDPKGGHVSD